MINRRTPIVSVIIPAYNAAETISATLACCRGQTFRDYEVVVIDDGSCDETVDHVINERHLSRSPVRVESLSHTGNPGKVRNRGLTIATGRYVQFLDADDVITSDKLSVQVAAIKSASDPESTVAYCDYRFFAEDAVRCTIERRGPPDGVYWPDDIARQFALYTVIHRFLYPRALLESVEGFDEDLTHTEDLDLWLRLLISGAIFVYQSKPMAYYRERVGHSVSHPEQEALCRVAVAEKLRRQISRSTLGEQNMDALNAIVEMERAKRDEVLSAVRKRTRS
jgi:glycosyltransferase involved in cell wall biosynthesis